MERWVQLQKEVDHWRSETLRYRLMFRILVCYLIFDIILHFDLLS